MKLTLFLGAGASAFISHPTTVELLDRVQKRVDLNMPTEQKKFTENLFLASDLEDVEKLYDSIDNIINLKDHITNTITDKIYYDAPNGPIRYEIIVYELEKLKSTIREILLSAFKISTENLGKIPIMYNRVLSAMYAQTDDIRVITTNYDKVIERYCERHQNLELVDGFNPTPNADGRVWNGTWEPKTNKRCLYLTKLHGSITWQKDNNTIIDQKTPGIRDIDDDIMIFPTLGPKNYSEFPFPELMNNFEKTLNDTDVLIVIGFSYRDPQINELIIRRLADGMKLVSISPTPEDMNRMLATKGEPDDIIIEDFAFKHFKHLGAHAFAYGQKFDINTIDEICIAINAFWNKQLIQEQL